MVIQTLDMNIMNKKPLCFIQYCIKLLIRLFFIIACFTFLLTLVWCIPNHLLYDNMESSLEIINREGRDWAYTFTYAVGSRLDNVTDGTMLEAVYDYESLQSPFLQALSINRYSRYWHGYLVVLRPLMVILDYVQIRYLYMFVHMMLLSLAAIIIKQKFNTFTALAFTASLASTYYGILAFSLQYSSVYFVMMGTVIYILNCYDSEWSVTRTGNLFLLIGALTNFVDFLTVPLITLGIPLVFVLMMNIKSQKGTSNIKNYKTLLCVSSTWGIGYCTTWIIKWILSGIFLSVETYQEVFERILLRTNGSESVPVNRMNLLYDNFIALLPPNLLNIPLIKYILLGSSCALVLLFLVRKRNKLYLKSYIPLLIVALYPYIWYAVFANHSQVHTIFTYRAQLVSVFAFIIVFAGCIQCKYSIKQ